MKTAAKRSERVTELQTSSGAAARIEGEVVSIVAKGGAVIASYDAASGELRLSAPGDLRLAAPNGKVLIEGEAISLRAPEADLSVGQWSFRAERVIEKVGDVYRTVDGLLETRAKRLRTLVAGTLELFGRRTTINSEKDTRIDGERIQLG